MPEIVDRLLGIFAKQDPFCAKKCTAVNKEKKKRARCLSKLLRQAAIFHFRRFPLQVPVWVGFGSNGKSAEFSIGKSSEYTKNPVEIKKQNRDPAKRSRFWKELRQNE